MKKDTPYNYGQNADIEETLVKYILNTDMDALAEQAIDNGKILVLTVLGTTIAGAKSEGYDVLLDQVREWGGREDATILIHGGRVPAHNAAFINSFMARALDFCDGMSPGMHLGSTCVPVALAAAELSGGCSGKDFLTYLVVAAEAAARVNACSMYDGFDPTGVCAIFGATAIAGRMLHLNEKQMLNALALAFNKSGGSFQSNIDGAMSVRVIQGFASQGGIICAQLAKKGVTGPKNFLKGQYGYFHLYGNDEYDLETLFGGWGERSELTKLAFKRYPSCWATTSSIDAMLSLVKTRDLTPDDVKRISITMTTYSYKLVGHPYKIGDNPKINAQFNVRYCVANALFRHSVRLEHFDEPAINDPKLLAIVDKIDVTHDPDLEKEGRNCVVMRVETKQGTMYEEIIRRPRGGPGVPLTMDEHIERFHSCFNYAGKLLAEKNAEKILSMVRELDTLQDVRDFIPLLLAKD